MLPASPGLPLRLAPLILALIIAVAECAHCQPPEPIKNGDETKPKDQQPVKRLTVGECIAIAIEKQPKLAALRASIASSEASARGVQNAPLIVRLTGDHKYRIQQACTGVQVMQAEYEQGVHDVTQAVVWTYYSVVYARQQNKVARDAVEFVDFYRDQVEKIVNDKKGGNREINQITLNRLIARLADGQRLHIRAQSGLDLARAGLREAMGVEHTFEFEPADDALPDFAAIEINKEDLITHAQTRRGEVIMAGLAAEVTRIEAYAQWAIRLRYRAETFASGADIHTRPLPYGSREGEYRPDTVGPEMPVNMIGRRHERSEKAWALVDRAQAVADKTKGLVTLEAESAWTHFHFAGLAMEAAKRQADAGNKNLALLKEVAGEKVSTSATLEQLLQAQGEAAQGSAAYNEAVYNRIAALANIERISAGGFRIKYPGR